MTDADRTEVAMLIGRDEAGESTGEDTIQQCSRQVLPRYLTRRRKRSARPTDRIWHESKLNVSRPNYDGCTRAASKSDRPQHAVSARRVSARALFGRGCFAKSILFSNLTSLRYRPCSTDEVAGPTWM